MPVTSSILHGRILILQQVLGHGYCPTPFKRRPGSNVKYTIFQYTIFCYTSPTTSCPSIISQSFIGMIRCSTYKTTSRLHPSLYSLLYVWTSNLRSSGLDCISCTISCEDVYGHVLPCFPNLSSNEFVLLLRRLTNYICCPS